ncbi:MAG TPA: 2-oxoacid:acceptor oxidoreductase subunit alpha [candidate division Zixibacteria bacterium]|nr:2-oxoacid:acceptor oxidoreductase subunit alpha [candidate division Zixibacteria bacterium]
MASIEVAPTAKDPAQSPVVNDFSIQVATVNGSGSQSANSVLLRAICHMGVPVSGKNLFPSNIAGLPTWYIIRASKDGYMGMKRQIDFLVAMNPETAQEDVRGLASGAVVLFDEPLNLNEVRSDLIFYTVPFDKLTADVCPVPKLRKLVKNMVYVGVMTYLLGLEMEVVLKAIDRQFEGKAKAVELNQNACKVGFDYAAANLKKIDPYRIQRMSDSVNKVIIDGNEAGAIGTMFAGVTVVGWYPITPSSTLIETLIEYMKEYRIGPDGKATFAIVQAEDELAAIGMVLGAAWAGARAMTATAGPGISLMAEFTGLGYYAEIPAVVWNVQRVGPSTGLPTRTQQGDIISTAYLSHGDTKHVMLFPASPYECFECGMEAFDLAEALQTPVFVMSDLDLGMNVWVTDPFKWPEKPINRGKVLGKEELEKLGSFARYRDVDGDAVGYRTLPGTEHPNAAYFTRGSGHNDRALYSERPEDYVSNMDRLLRKSRTAAQLASKPEIIGKGHSVGIIAYGTSHWSTLETLDQLKKEFGIEADYLRVLAFPFADEVTDFVKQHDRVYVVDQNRDGQMCQLLKCELPNALAPKLFSVLHYDGWPIDARSITNSIVEQENANSTQEVK